MTSLGCVLDVSIIFAYTVGTAIKRVIGRWTLQVERGLRWNRGREGGAEREGQTDGGEWVGEGKREAKSGEKKWREEDEGKREDYRDGGRNTYDVSDQSC
jgi:hypothetical protein